MNMNPRPAVTKKQRRILDFVSSFIEKHDYSPSYREIAGGLNLKSVATVAQHIDALVDKGLLVKGHNSARSLVPVEEVQASVNAPGVGLPVMGMIAAGKPIQSAAAHDEKLEVPAFMVGTKKSYVLQVKGRSMEDEGVVDGDYVVVAEKEQPSNGEMVVALLNNDEATLKRYYKEDSRVRLQPSNSSMEPIYVDAKTPLNIQGVVIGLIRKY